MSRYVQSLRALLWIIAVALVVVRAGDAHMHLCFDGQEPPRSLHVGEVQLDHHEGEHTEAAHQDVDVDALDTALAKKVADANDVLPLLLAATVIDIVAIERYAPERRERQNPSPSLPYLFLPQLRGPPV